jgi:uncharacterized protein
MTDGRSSEVLPESASKPPWFSWHGPRLRVLPILLVIALGFAIVAASFTAARAILLHLDGSLVPRVWPLLIVAEIFELLLALLGITIARRWLPRAEFGTRWPRGRTLVGTAVVWGFAFGLIMLLSDHGARLVRGVAAASPAQTAIDIAGWLAFELLLVGICEETLFRGFLLGVLEALSPSRVRFGSFSISTAGITIAMLFALAHASNFATDPWPVALGQQIYALALGILYVWLRERSGSLLAPIVTHSLSDFTETGLVFVLAAMLPHA